MTDVKNRYPLSTSDGKYIPMEVIRPNSFLSVDFTAIGASAAEDVPAAVELFSVFSNEDCFIQFAAAAASATAIVSGTPKVDAIMIPANVIVTISAPIDKKSFSVRGLTASGTLNCNFLETWTGLSLSSQITRR